MDGLTLTESFYSKRNKIFWKLRSTLAFARGGYRETNTISEELSAEATSLEYKYALHRHRTSLHPENYKKNLATLQLLEKMLLPYLSTLDLSQQKTLDILEPGCQDFSRLPALDAFFRRHGRDAKIHGLEVDPYPLLQGFYSRADKAEFYISLIKRPHSYSGGDFFQWNQKHHLTLCFYPFVSPHPALAWGLPAEFGSAVPWIKSLCRVLSKDGMALVVHQGSWEEEEFDEARNVLQSPLQLLKREEIHCDFYPHPHPVCASLYRKI